MKLLFGIFLTVLLLKEVESQCQSPTLCHCKLFANSTKTASSSFSPAFSPSQAWLENEYNANTTGNITVIQNGGSWRPLDSDTSTWYTLDFGANKTIKNVSTKGNAHFNHWISRYHLYTKTDGGSRFKYLRTFGNTNGHAARVLSVNVTTRYIKIKPVLYNVNVSLRIEVQGCDQVDGGWGIWGSWLKCRSPCGTGIQFRWRTCTNPVPNFFGSDCEGSQYDSQSCHLHPCTPVTMSLELFLVGQTWSADLSTLGSLHPLCINLKENLRAVYVPEPPISIGVSCSFFQIGGSSVGVTADLTFDKTDAVYNMKLQDGLHYGSKINTMPAVLRHFRSTQVPYSPEVTSFESKAPTKFTVNLNSSINGAPTHGFAIYFRLNTTDPDGDWQWNNPVDPKGNCDGTSNSMPVYVCNVYGRNAFHNYTVRLVPYNLLGYGFSPNPFSVTTMEDKPAPPANFSGVMASSTQLNISWDAVPLIDMNGNSEGYELAYKRTDSIDWSSIRILDHWVTKYEITGLEEYINYDVKIRSKNSLLWGDYVTSVVVVRTDEDLPAAAPRNIQVNGITSQSLQVLWNEVRAKHKNGIIINYKINISLGTSVDEQNSSMITVIGDVRNKVISNLEKWAYYTVTVAASTIKGIGIFSAPKTGRTLEDRPTASPGSFHGAVNSSTVTTFWWQLIPLPFRHGVITQYRITFFKLNDVANKKYSYHNGETLQTGVVTNLWYWTYYNFSVAARTSAGYGPDSDYVTLRTEQHVPTRPPENFRGINSSSYSIRLDWDPVLESFRHGYILSYKIRYKSAKDVGMMTIINNGSSNRSLEITRLYNYTEYAIGLSAATIKGYGVEGRIIVRTDDAIPTLPPASLTASSPTSTSLSVIWQRIPEISRHGVILGYLLNYTDMVFNTTLHTSKHNWGTLQLLLTSLEKFRFYRIDIAGYTKKGVGPYTSTTQITDEDLPAVAPTNLTGSVLSATSVRFSWHLIPVLLRNGIITKYKIKYTSLETSPHVGFTEFPGESVQQGIVPDLRFWTVYNFAIAASTSKGYGTDGTIITLRTEEHVPTRPPVNFIGFNTSSYSIQLTWQQIEQAYRHGVILGYTITYVSNMDTEVVMRNEGSSNVSLELRGLHNYTDYNITLTGYNSKGDGATKMVTVRTEETVPSQAPASINSYNTSSTSLWVEWSRVPEIGRRGVILGYVMVYTHVVYNSTRNITLHDESTLSHNLTGLDEYRLYRIAVAGFTKFGIGPYTVTTAVTDEDAPAAPPATITGRFTKSTGLSITWSNVPDKDQNGQIQAVTVFYKLFKRTAPVRTPDGRQYLRMIENLRNSTQSQSRKRRSVNTLFDSGYPDEDNGHEECVEFHKSRMNLQQPVSGSIEEKEFSGYDFCISSNHYFRGSPYISPVTEQDMTKDSALWTNSYGGLYETESSLLTANRKHHRETRSVSVTSFASVTVAGNESGLLLNNLDPYVNYTIVLQATTSKGAGPLSQSILVETDESVPTAPPQNLTAAHSSSTSILANWLPVPYADSNGIVYAYVIAVKLANSSGPWLNHTQYEPSLQFDIPNLHKYVNYSIKVCAITSKGSGPFSPEIITVTDQDVPSAPPANVTGESITSTTLRIKWKPVLGNGVPSCCVHGELTGYELWYGKRYPAAGDNVTRLSFPRNQLSVDIPSLVTYTPYSIEVAAKTIKGYGAKQRIKVWTSESRPVVPPQNVTVANATSTSLLVEWNEIPFMERKGDIRGYAIYYKITRSNHPLSVKWLDMYHFTGNYTVVYQPPIQIETDDVIRRLNYELTGLMKFMEYTIHLTSYTKIGTGSWTFANYAMTDQDVPSLAAVNVTGHTKNSSAILVSWDPIPVTRDPSIEVPVCCVHGNLTGYTIFYSRVTKNLVENVTLSLAYLKNITLHGNFTAGGNSTGNDSSNVNSTRLWFTLTRLDAAKNYTINVAGNTIKGHGVLGEAIHVVTKENVPSREPNAITGWKLSSTRLYVEWSDILWEYRNGIIVEYIIYYRETAKPWSSEISKIVHAQYNSTILFNLRKWTYYTIRVFGATSKGQGRISANITLRTDEDVPSKTPQNVQAADYTGPYSILVKWSPVPGDAQHGVVLGHRVFYTKVSEADEEIREKRLLIKTVSASTHDAYLEYLPTYCTYQIRITSFTIKGDGPLSDPILARTCRCVKHLYTNWWRLPPYNYEKDLTETGAGSPVVSNLSFVPKGLFAGYLRDMAIWACGNCYGPRGHGYSVVHFDIDRNGKKSQKSTEVNCIADVDETFDFTFPLHGRIFQTSFLSEGKFLPFVDHPEAAMVVLKKITVVSRSTAMIQGLMSIWPLIVLNIVFAAVAGFFIWSLDCTSNPEEFPGTFIQGMWQGFWWAYVTMTTVGYGDITPRSLAAKIFSIVWILMGLVLYAILIGNVTTALSVKQQIILRKVQLYDTQVALTNGSFEEKIALANSAKPVGRKTVTEILNMVKDDKIPAALVDTYILSEYDHFFGDTALYVQRTLKSKSFNYGVGLMGNITKLSKLFVQYKIATQADFSTLLEKYISVKKKDESTASAAIDADENMFAPSSPMYLKAVYAILALIGIASAAGIVVTIFNSIRKNKLKHDEEVIESLRMQNPSVRAMEHALEEACDICGDFLETMTKKIEEIDQTQLKDKLRLIFLYRFLNRSKEEGTSVKSTLVRHGIHIKDRNKCYREIDRMKAIDKSLNGKKRYNADGEIERFSFEKTTGNATNLQEPSFDMVSTATIDMESSGRHTFLTRVTSSNDFAQDQTFLVKESGNVGRESISSIEPLIK